MANLGTRPSRRTLVKRCGRAVRFSSKGGPVMERCGCVKAEWKPACHLLDDNRLMAWRTGNTGWGLKCKSSVILRQQDGSHRTVSLGDDPEAVGTLPIGG